MTQHTEAKILIVDQNDNPIGAAAKEDAWKEGLIHRIVHVIVRDEAGNILLQKRAETMRLFPGLWTDSASGHVDEGEDWLEAGLREAQEEIGLENAELKELGTFFYDGEFNGKLLKRFNRVYVTTVAVGTEFTFDPGELSETRWFPLEEAKALDESLLTPSLKEILTNYLS